MTRRIIEHIFIYINANPYCCKIFFSEVVSHILMFILFFVYVTSEFFLIIWLLWQGYTTRLLHDDSLNAFIEICEQMLKNLYLSLDFLLLQGIITMDF
ncbi:hypothetical protein C922_03598 [Plasmodium inui San Antonio 1]|uniref:Uncharacterized protein n=1 Tax=Plasmodium inui San Antonio 1 TaxID=1237626 RepID=W7A9Q4_9APIC|nr:hypothetical protein C922_03598 [Plasmodium inui San Antonio 1]EUD65874.1 hypothetical protein C922_03598 [Plasmodium inui San Antonio 1]